MFTCGLFLTNFSLAMALSVLLLPQVPLYLPTTWSRMPLGTGA
jgi:hypothetical protein